MGIYFQKKCLRIDRPVMERHCSMCGGPLTPDDSEGICHLCKLSIIFNDDIYPDIDDFAC